MNSLNLVSSENQVEEGVTIRVTNSPPEKPFETDFVSISDFLFSNDRLSSYDKTMIAYHLKSIITLIGRLDERVSTTSLLYHLIKLQDNI